MVRDINIKFVLPSIYINFDIQTTFEVNQTQIGHSIPKENPKLTKVAISQNQILPKCHSPKSLLLLHFSINFSETFRKIGFWGQIFFGGLNQKSAMISMCKSIFTKSIFTLTNDYYVYLIIILLKVVIISFEDFFYIVEIYIFR